jgi:hypothetical protein
MTTAHRYVISLDCADIADPPSIQPEAETRTKRLQEHSMLNRFLHIHSLNSVIKDRRPRTKSNNEISELNFSELKQSTDERLGRLQPLRKRRVMTGTEVSNGYWRMERKTRRLLNDGRSWRKQERWMQNQKTRAQRKGNSGFYP